MAEHPTDRGVREMMAPLLELSDERLLYGDPWGLRAHHSAEIAPHHDRLVIQESRIRCALGQPDGSGSSNDTGGASGTSRCWVLGTKPSGTLLYEAGDARGAIEAFG